MRSRRTQTRQEKGEHDGQVAARIRKLRRQRGETQKEVCAATEIPLGTYRDWETGRSVPREGPHLRALAEYFRVGYDELLTGEKPGKES